MKTGPTELPGVTESPGMTGKTRCTWCGQRTPFTGVVVGTGSWIPGTGSRNRVPVIKPEPGPGMTGTCSESSGRLTDDYSTDPFIANRAFEPMSQKRIVPPGILTQTEGIYPLIALPGQTRLVWTGYRVPVLVI